VRWGRWPQIGAGNGRAGVEPEALARLTPRAAKRQRRSERPLHNDGHHTQRNTYSSRTSPASASARIGSSFA
jgi:hypothetical protein